MCVEFGIENWRLQQRNLHEGNYAQQFGVIHSDDC
jgi:hypothetical protein